jgi:D-cysteine desulfhydrase/L-cysteate sulfo-lyase
VKKSAILTKVIMNPLLAIPRLTISHQPTPLEVAPRLSAHLGCEIFIKRDDCTGLAGGGNKARKLEYLLADAKYHGADILLTIGGLQSNHARQTAAAAAKFGFDCELILQDVAGTPKTNYQDNGNLLIDQLCGAQIHHLRLEDDCQAFAAARIAALKAEGRKPYLIPIGGSNVIGSLGYVRCAQELLQQIREQEMQVDQIVMATGSAGTQAGLLAGLILEYATIPVLGINVSRPQHAQETMVTELLQNTLLYLGRDPVLAYGRVHTNGDYFGTGYGIPTSEMQQAVRLCAQLEGLLIDPVYTGKAMAGLMDLCAKGVIAQGSRVLFLHTGGSQALFAYQEIFA